MIANHVNNPFLSTRTSNGNFSKYAAIHIERLKANISATTDILFGTTITTIFNTMISQTENLFNDWKSSIDLSATEKSQKEGKTISVKQAFKDLKSFISIKHGVIADKFHKGTPIYEEFFPLGLNEYSKVSMKDADVVFKRFINALELHKDAFDANMLTEANEKFNTYTLLRQAQLQKIGRVKDEISNADEKRNALGLQLYKNLLTLLLIYADNPEKVDNYFDESIIAKKSKKEAPIENKVVGG
jgi:hypothetical protein